MCIINDKYILCKLMELFVKTDHQITEVNRKGQVVSSNPAN